jgi:Icc protein
MAHLPDKQKGHFSNLPSGSLKILQLTDTHLYADPSQCLLGLNTLNTLDLVIEQALEQLGMPDLLLATGDLVHDASDAGYKRFRSRISKIGPPVYTLAGNHDLPGKMQQLLNQGNVHYQRRVNAAGWHLIFLDSTIPGKTGGHLTPDQLSTLERDLAEQPENPTLICMHHQPVPVGSQWIDNIGLGNSAEFMEMVDRHAQVKGVLCGHIHQQFESLEKDVKLLGTPSTCIQFTSGEDDFAIDAAPPGYRWLTLLPDGTINSGVELLSEVPVGLDLASMGY